MAVQFKWALASNFACKLLKINAIPQKNTTQIQVPPGVSHGVKLRGLAKFCTSRKWIESCAILPPNVAHRSPKGECGKFEKFSLLSTSFSLSLSLWENFGSFPAPVKVNEKWFFSFFVLLGEERFSSIFDGKWQTWVGCLNGIVSFAENTMVIMDWIRFIIMEPTQQFLRLEIEREFGVVEVGHCGGKLNLSYFCRLSWNILGLEKKMSWIWWFLFQCLPNYWNDFQTLKLLNSQIQLYIQD